MSRAKPSQKIGEHPRARGENYGEKSLVRRISGTSPRTRGKRMIVAVVFLWGRNIPAHAGKTPGCQTSDSASWEHPRARGENHGRPGRYLSIRGTSPRTRGKPTGASQHPPGTGNIPAHAGKTVPHATTAASRREHPRARGENNDALSSVKGTAGTSPRTRGKPCYNGLVLTPNRNIPAHAGKTRNQVSDWCLSSGTSPRTRGKHCGPPPRNLINRNIPAHAGKTG